MDPWLQTFWESVHGGLIYQAGERLNDLLSPGLVAKPQQRVIIESDGVAIGQTVPDVLVVKRPSPVPGQRETEGGVLLAEPVIVSLPVEYEQPYIEIIDTKTGGTVVTVIEIVSPSNKRPGDGRDQYLQKQAEVLASKTNLVEIDLIRGAPGVTVAHSWNAPPATEAHYHISVRRASVPLKAEVYPLSLRERLPSFRIPLRPQGQDVRLDLQAVLDHVYSKYKYAELIDYDRPPLPPLEPDDAAWAAERVKEWREKLNPK